MRFRIHGQKFSPGFGYTRPKPNPWPTVLCLHSLQHQNILFPSSSSVVLSSLFPSLSVPEDNRPICSSLNLRWVSLIHTHSSNYIWCWVVWVLLLNFVGFDGLFHSFFFGHFFFVVVVLVFWIFSRFLMFVLFSGFIPYFMR